LKTNWSFNLYEFAFKYKYDSKYCSTKSSLQNLHENGDTSLWMNFNEFAFKYKYNCKYGSANFLLLGNVLESEKFPILNLSLLYSFYQPISTNVE
jgi:hypothetical protein